MLIVLIPSISTVMNVVPVKYVIACAMVPRALNNDAALFSMARDVVGGFGIPVSTSRVADHRQTRQAYPIDHLFPGNQPGDVLPRQVQQGPVNPGNSAQQAMRAAPGHVVQMLQARLSVPASMDGFLLTGCAALLFIPTALMLSGARPRPSGEGH